MPSTTPLTREALKRLRSAAKDLPAAEQAYAAAAERLRDLSDTIAATLRELHGVVDMATLAKASRLSEQEVSAIVAAEQDQAPPVQPAGPVPLAERTIAAAGDVATLAGATRPSTQRFERRKTLWVHLGKGWVYDPERRRGWTRPAPMTLPRLLAELLGAQAARVYICDGPDWCVEPGDASRAAAVLRWITEPVPGWVTDEQGHYVSDPDTPVGHWRHVESGHRVELHRAGAWFGPSGEYNPKIAGTAWHWLDAAVAERFDGAGLLSTPSTAGKALWLRSLPKGAELPILSMDLRKLIKATSGQGRQQLVPPAEPGAELPGVWLFDGRLMYAALTFAMPIGEPTFWAGEPDDATRTLMSASRWRITATVPKDWDHVGLLPAPREGRRQAWRYPSEPGETFSSWCSGREAALARQHGWDVTIHEGMSWKTGKVLDKWADRLKDIAAAAPRWAEQEGIDREPVELVERAVRFILLHTIGAFASIGRRVTRSVPADRPELAADARPIDGVSLEGDRLVWHEREPMSPWSEQSSHPEYSAETWGRARVRLLQGPHDYPEMGALSVPRGSVVAFDTDALYLAADPGWEDDQRAGRLRLKGSVGPMPYPSSLQELRDSVKG